MGVEPVEYEAAAVRFDCGGGGGRRKTIIWSPNRQFFVKGCLDLVASSSKPPAASSASPLLSLPLKTVVFSLVLTPQSVPEEPLNFKSTHLSGEMSYFSKAAASAVMKFLHQPGLLQSFKGKQYSATSER